MFIARWKAAAHPLEFLDDLLASGKVHANAAGSPAYAFSVGLRSTSQACSQGAL
jgi:hypothetical protein